jgi:hypothetical protein
MDMRIIKIVEGEARVSLCYDLRLRLLSDLLHSHVGVRGPPRKSADRTVALMFLSLVISMACKL